MKEKRMWIMRRAWNLFYRNSITFSQALKYAWKEMRMK
jgi:hypothetical protein